MQCSEEREWGLSQWCMSDRVWNPVSFLLPLSPLSIAASCSCSFPTRTVCLWFLTMWKELSVRLRTSLASKWIQFQSCARCKRHTLKQASILPHTYKHAQFLSLPIAISFLVYCSHFFLSFCPFLCLFPSLWAGGGAGEWRYISDRVTRDNDLQRAKKAFTQPGRRDGRMGEGRRQGEAFLHPCSSHYLLAGFWHWQRSIFLSVSHWQIEGR